MTNLEKLKEVFPYDDWSKFYCSVGWMCEEYDPNKITKTNFDVFKEVFGQTTGNKVEASDNFWNAPYMGDYKK